MSSTNSVNFRLRQNKAIERVIVFDCLDQLMSGVGILPGAYVGLGSVWFVDFDMAHRQLGIQEMVSVGSDPVIYKRARFNKPLRTVTVLEGLSSERIPELLEKPEFRVPMIVWLDYDSSLDELMLEELEHLALSISDNSVLLTTFSALPPHYGQSPKARLERLRLMFGDDLVDGRSLASADVKSDARMMRTLADLVEAHLISRTLAGGREPSLLPAFKLHYQDAAPMVTVGGFLPSSLTDGAARAMVSSPSWEGRSEDGIITPPLTAKEVAALRSLLPNTEGLSRAAVQAAGFDLTKEQAEAFGKHYLRYPLYGQLL